MKPNWKDAPEWANYLAMDEDGRWWWYQHTPTINKSVWKKESGHAELAKPNHFIDWFETLEERPNEDE